MKQWLWPSLEGFDVLTQLNMCTARCGENSPRFWILHHAFGQGYLTKHRPQLLGSQRCHGYFQKLNNAR